MSSATYPPRLPIWRGAWDDATRYAPGDLVLEDGTAFLAVVRNLNSPPTGVGVWIRYFPGGRAGVGGGHTIFDEDTELPMRRFLRFTGPGVELVDDDVTRTVVTTTAPPMSAPELEAAMGTGFPFEALPIDPDGGWEAAGDIHPAPEVGVDEFGMAHLRGAIKRVDLASDIIGVLDFLRCPNGDGVLLPVSRYLTGAHALTIDGDDDDPNTYGTMHLAGEDALDDVHYLDGVSYPLGIGFGGAHEGENVFQTGHVSVTGYTAFGHPYRTITGSGVGLGRPDEGFIVYTDPQRRDFSTEAGTYTWSCVHGPDVGLTQSGPLPTDDTTYTTVLNTFRNGESGTPGYSIFSMAIQVYGLPTSRANVWEIDFSFGYRLVG